VSAPEVPRIDDETLRERLAYHGYATVAWLGRTLPPHTGRALFRLFGTLAFYLASRQRAVVAANQARVLGRPSDDPLVVANTRAAFRSYGRYWYDTFSLTSMSHDAMLAAIDWDGVEHILEPISRGQGVLLVMPHLGNWDACSRNMYVRGVPMATVAERLRPERLYQLFVREREASEVQVIALGSAGIGKTLAAAIDDGKLLGLLADRDLTGGGIPVQLFGATLRMPAGPAMLALSTDAATVIMGSYETPTGWRAIVRPLAMPELTGDRRADARAITQNIADAFEPLIAASPADWHVFQPAWPADEA